MLDILSIGSVCTDIVLTGKLPHTKTSFAIPTGHKILVSAQIHTGGGAYNTAVGYARMGLKTGIVCKLGSDPAARAIKEKLKKEKIKFFGSDSKVRTGTSIILSSPSIDRAILVDKAANSTLVIREVKTPKTKWIHITSLVGKSLQTEQKLAAHYSKQGTKIAFNPSEYICALGVKKLNKILSQTNILLVNLCEAKTLLKSKANVHKLLTNLTKLVPEVVITNSANGVFAATTKEKFSLKPKKAKVVDSTGAGDAFASAYVSARILGKNIPEAMQYGCIQAKSILGNLGSTNNLLSLKEVVHKLKLTNKPKGGVLC